MSDRELATAEPFVKRYPRYVTEERRKAEELHRIGLECGFISPAVLGMDASDGVVRLERLSDLTPLRSLYLEHVTGPPSEESVAPVFRSAGAVLACLHEHLSLETQCAWSPSGRFRRLLERRSRRAFDDVLGSARRAFLHCDFGFGNVHVAGASRSLAVLDGSPNGYVTFHPHAFGPTVLDLASFVACLRGLVGFRAFRRLRRTRIPALESAFVAGYESRSGVRVDRGVLDAVAYAVAGTYLHIRLRSSAVVRLALHVMFPARGRPVVEL